MTGLWQVSGRSRLTFDEMIRLDLFYIENWSVGFDIGLILRTIPAVAVRSRSVLRSLAAADAQVLAAGISDDCGIEAVAPVEHEPRRNHTPGQ